MAASLTPAQLRTIAEIYGGPGSDTPVLIARAGRDIPASVLDDLNGGTVYVTSDALQIRVHSNGEHEEINRQMVWDFT